MSHSVKINHGPFNKGVTNPHHWHHGLANVVPWSVPWNHCFITFLIQGDEIVSAKFNWGIKIQFKDFGCLLQETLGCLLSYLKNIPPAMSCLPRPFLRSHSGLRAGGRLFPCCRTPFVTEVSQGNCHLTGLTGYDISPKVNNLWKIIPTKIQQFFQDHWKITDLLCVMKNTKITPFTYLLSCFFHPKPCWDYRSPVSVLSDTPPPVSTSTKSLLAGTCRTNWYWIICQHRIYTVGSSTPKFGKFYYYHYFYCHYWKQENFSFEIIYPHLDALFHAPQYLGNLL